MITPTITIQGTPALLAALRRHDGAAARRAASGALLEVAETRIMGPSKRLVPVDTGALRSSGHVQPPVEAGPVVTVTLGYGGPAGATVKGAYVGYAIYVHENLTARHPVGQAKYLEQPLLEALPDLPAAIAAALAARFGGA